MYIEIEISEKEFKAIEKLHINLKSFGIGTDINPVLDKMIRAYKYSNSAVRDALVYRKHNEGASYSELAEELGITRERVRQLYLREERRRNYQKQTRDARQEQTSFYDCCIKAAEELERDRRVATKAYNSLSRSGIITEIMNGTKDLDSYPDHDLMCLYGFGVAQLEVCRKANELYKALEE